jgi:hypothetical protein
MVTAKPANVRSRYGRHGGGDQEGGGEQPARGVATVDARSQQPTRRREEARAGAHVGDHEDRGEEGDDGREVTHGVARLLERDQPGGQGRARGAEGDQRLHAARRVPVGRHQQRQQRRDGHRLGHQMGEGRHARNLRHL